MTSSNTVPRAATFTLPAGSTAYSFYPGAWRDAGTTNIWLASGNVLGIVCDSETLAGAGFVLDIHDYFDTSTYTLIKGGAFTEVGGITVACGGGLTVVGPGTLYTGPVLDDPTGAVESAGGIPASQGGFECYATNKPAAFVTGNKKYTIVPNLQTLQSYPARAQCLNGMAIMFTGGGATASEHKITVIYEPLTLGRVRRKLYIDFSSGNKNSGALSYL